MFTKKFINIRNKHNLMNNTNIIRFGGDFNHLIKRKAQSLSAQQLIDEVTK